MDFSLIFSNMKKKFRDYSHLKKNNTNFCFHQPKEFDDIHQ